MNTESEAGRASPEQREREEFEKFATSRGLSLSADIGPMGRWRYAAIETNEAWAAWQFQAGRASISAPSPATAGLTPPLIGTWHHGQGYLVSGSIRIAAWDCDTNPPVEFRDRMLDWMCDTLNAAVDAHEKREVAGCAPSMPAWMGVKVTFGDNEPKPRCRVCDKPFAEHGSYPTCATHPYTSNGYCQTVLGAVCVGAECVQGCVRARALGSKQ